MAALDDLDGLAISSEIADASVPLGKDLLVFKDEAVVAEQVHQVGKVVGCRKAGRLAAGCIEMPVGRIERHGEQAARLFSPEDFIDISQMISNGSDRV